MDNSGDKKENNSFSVPSYFWEDSLHFWRARQLSLLLHLASASAVKGQVTLQTLGIFYSQLHWLSLLHFLYWDFFTSAYLSFFGQSIVCSSDCWARWPGQLSMPASHGFCHWWTSLSHRLSLFALSASLVLWLEFPLSWWPKQFSPIWHSSGLPHTQIGK